jgi:hypothetical protein
MCAGESGWREHVIPDAEIESATSVRPSVASRAPSGFHPHLPSHPLERMSPAGRPASPLTKRAFQNLLVIGSTLQHTGELLCLALRDA